MISKKQDRVSIVRKTPSLSQTPKQESGGTEAAMPARSPAPQVVLRRAQANLSGLRLPDFLALHRIIGNRQVLRAVSQRRGDDVEIGVQAKQSLATGRQDRANLIIQRMKVGDDGAGAVLLASKHFNESDALWKAALDVLKQMEKAGTDYKSVDEIIQAVEADPKVKQERAAANVQRAAREAEEKEKAESPELYDYGRYGILTEYHIKKGTWQLIPGRKKPDYELITTVGEHAYSFHVHPPQFGGRRPIAGQVMRNGRMTDTATPDNVIDFIINAKGLPAGW
jgi:hypothetical protein